MLKNAIIIKLTKKGSSVCVCVYIYITIMSNGTDATLLSKKKNGNATLTQSKMNGRKMVRKNEMISFFSLL